MSNLIIPTLYRDIINKVIEDARVDFESYNIDESILDELRITWEKKLFDTHVADFSVLEDDDYYNEPAPSNNTIKVPFIPISSQTSFVSNSANSPSPISNLNRPIMGSFAPSPRPSPKLQPVDAIEQVDGPSSLSDEGGDDINSDLDDDLESCDEADAEAQNQVLCLYEKVNRTKNKWKCVMREGIIHVIGKDYAFGKLTGEYQF